MSNEKLQQETLATLQSVTLNEIEALYAIETPDKVWHLPQCFSYGLPMGEVRPEHRFFYGLPKPPYFSELTADEECAILAKIILPAAAQRLLLDEETD